MSVAVRESLRVDGGWRPCCCWPWRGRESANDPARPAAEPVAAVQAMALRLAEDDLVGYAKLSVPPGQYQRLQQAWVEGPASGR